MTTVNLSVQSVKTVLITRPAARVVASAMQAAAGDGEIALNTDGILRIGVSFFDEALLIFNEIIAQTGDDNLRLVYRKAPAMESLKNLVPNRGLTLLETPDGEWVISRTGVTS